MAWKKLARVIIMTHIIILLNILTIFKKTVLTFFRFFWGKPLPEVVRTPELRFQLAEIERLGYKFKPNYVHLKIGGEVTLPRVHYLNEGPQNAKDVMLCLHGEPSWSFLYRKMIPILANNGYQVIVPDFIGFGKSDKYSHEVNYTHEMHRMTLRLLIEHLDLKNITLVCQDWGGLTGLSVVKDMPDRFSRIVVMNTGLPTGTDFGALLQSAKDYQTKLTVISRACNFMFWQSSVRFFGEHYPYKFLFKYLVGFRDEIATAYAAPFPSAEYKAGPAKWPLLVPVMESDPVACDMRMNRKFFESWRKPCLVMFSDRDPITKGMDKFFIKLIPSSEHVTIHGAGHFLQEDKGEEIARNIVQFAKRNAAVS